MAVVEYATMLAEMRRLASIDVPLLAEALRCGVTHQRAELFRSILQPLLDRPAKRDRRIMSLLREATGQRPGMAGADCQARQQDRQQGRRAIVERWEAACRAAKQRKQGRDKATRQFLAKLRNEGRNISRATLYRWRASLASELGSRRLGQSCPQWITLAEASRRSGFNEGHLRRLCRRHAVEGLARKVVRGSGQTAWEILEAADPAFAPRSTAVQTGIDARSNVRRGDN